MSIISLSTVWSDNQVLTASALNGNLNDIVNNYNGGITNANIDANAAIEPSKIDVTFPTGEIVGTTDSQVLSNKVLTKPTINASTQGIGSFSGTTPTLDLSLANIYAGILSGSTTFAVSNVTVGQVFMVEVHQGSGSSYTNTWFGGVTWVTPGGTAPIQTSASDGITTYGFRCTGANTYLGYLVGSS